MNTNYGCRPRSHHILKVLQDYGSAIVPCWEGCVSLVGSTYLNENPMRPRKCAIQSKGRIRIAAKHPEGCKAIPVGSYIQVTPNGHVTRGRMEAVYWKGCTI